MRVKDFMTRQVVSVTPEHSVRHAAGIMLRHGVSGLPVVDDAGVLRGILTEGDLMRRSELGNDPRVDVEADMEAVPRAEDGHRAAKAHAWCVHDAMTKEVRSVSGETTIAEAARLMDEMKVRRLPVMEQGHLAGIVSRHDVLKAFAAINPRRSRVADHSILLQVQTRLASNPVLRAARFEVKVSEGVVHLKGRVRHPDDFDLARIEAESVLGVVCVHLDLDSDHQHTD